MSEAGQMGTGEEAYPKLCHIEHNVFVEGV